MASNKNSANVEHVTNADAKIFSPFPIELNDIYFACESGNIFRFKDGIMKVLWWKNLTYLLVRIRNGWLP